MGQIIVEDQKSIIEIEQETTLVYIEETGVEVVSIGEQGPPGAPGATGATGAVGPGVNWRGAYSASEIYVLNDGVSNNGSSWRALRTSVGVTPVEGADWTIIAQKGDPGVDTEDKNYVHDQIAAASQWTVTHNLGKYPAIGVVDTANTNVIGDVEYLSVNAVRLTFSAPFSGKAFCN